MRNTKTLYIILAVAALAVIGLYLSTYFGGDAALTSVLSADKTDDTSYLGNEVITPNHFEKSSDDYRLELTESGEVVER